MVSENQWISDLETNIFSNVVAFAKPLLEKDYPDVRFTTESKSTQKPRFPTVYIHELTQVETGSTLDGKTVNAVMETMQAEITTNNDKSDAKKVTLVVLEAFKRMRFSGGQIGEIQYESDVYRSISRFSRLIGENDTLN